MRHGSTASGSELHVADELFWRRDGSSFPVEYWSHPMLQDGAGPRARWRPSSTSASGCKMQAALRQGEVRIAKLVDAVTDGVITIDADGRIVLFNRAAERLFGVAGDRSDRQPDRALHPASPARRGAPRRRSTLRSANASSPPARCTS